MLFSFSRNNLVLLQVGFKSLSYEMHEQQPAYDSNALFGKSLPLLDFLLPHDWQWNRFTAMVKNRDELTFYLLFVNRNVGTP